MSTILPITLTLASPSAIDTQTHMLFSILLTLLLFFKTNSISFGRQVKHWITFNEPLSFCYLGYGTGVNAPGRCSNRSICPEGNSTTEPYICAHNVLKSHALTVALYRSKYQQEQGGVIGITLDAMWSVPLTDSPAGMIIQLIRKYCLLHA